MPNAMEIITPLDEGALLFHRMHAREELGRLSEYQLELLSPDKNVPLDKILGQNVTITLQLADESYRYFNGFVSRFSAGGMHGRYFRYTATVRPWLWFLTRTADCRIFQDKTVPEIVEEIFADHPGLGAYELDLTETYAKRTYCVQYRESDFNFISRLLEHEGISYYYRHTEDHHTVVLTDTKHYPNPGYETLKFLPPEHFARPDVDHISSWDFTREVQPGVYAHTDYNFERPAVDLRSKKPLLRNYNPSDYEVFDYPGNYAQKSDGEQLAKVRIDEFGSQFEIAEATTNCRGLCVGSLFTLDGFRRDDQNVEHLVIGATFDLEYSDYEGMPGTGGTSYQCQFVSMSTATQLQFRPQRLTARPFVQGPQTAVVVGPAGDEIFTDQYGRVKVQFHWDRRGQRDEQSSCWVRVSHPWAGKGWGSVATPRIGQEVIVDFLEGDPDQPIITGRVYNADQQPPFGFPAGAVLSGIKSRTHKGAGYNELSMDDTAGKEKITIHGQYDMNTTVEHDQTDEIKNNRTSHIVVNDTLNVDADRTVHVKGKLAETVDTGQELTVTAGYKETISGGATRTIDGGHTETVTGKREMTVTGPIDQSATATIDIHATGEGTYSSNAKLTLSVAGSVIEIAPAGITISMGASTIKVDAAGVAVSGPKISLNG